MEFYILQKGLSLRDIAQVEQMGSQERSVITITSDISNKRVPDTLAECHVIISICIHHFGLHSQRSILSQLLPELQATISSIEQILRKKIQIVLLSQIHRLEI